MNNELIKAAQAVVDRWDSTDWKAAPTAEVMNRLRNALAELSRREDRFVLVVDLPVAFAKLQRAGEATLFFTESEYNALRDLFKGKKLVDAGAVVLSVEDAESLDSVLTTFRVGVRLEQGFDEHNKLRIAIEQARGKV
jgi:hypothetical protein